MEHDDTNDVLAVAACLRDAIRLKDVAVALSLMTDDVVLIGPAGPPIVGHDAVRDALFVPARWRQEVEETVVDVSVEVLGRTAIVVRSISATATLTIGRGALPAITMVGRTISVFRRQVDGWKLARWLNLMEKAQEEQRRQPDDAINLKAATEASLQAHQDPPRRIIAGFERFRMVSLIRFARDASPLLLRHRSESKQMAFIERSCLA